jgi:hypothetical protein
MLQVFYVDVVYVSVAMYIVASIYSKYFIYFRRMLQMFYMNVAYIAVVIHICCKWML